MQNINFRSVNVTYGESKPYPTLKNPEEVATFLRSIAPNNSQEHVIVVYLSGSHAPIGYSVVFSGTANSCTLHPREVYQRAVLLGACKIILAHNHPSGSCEPSKEDLLVTKQLREAGKTLAIPLLDHVIFSDTECHSMQEAGEI